MKFAAPAIVLASSTFGAAQAVTATILPSEPAPSGCASSVDSHFKITVIEAFKTYSSAQDSSSCDNDALLVLSLNNGRLSDAQNRTGYIASNRQFQFDAPPQSGALLTAGFSVCSNGSLALGGSTVWYQCHSGDFSNLYDTNWAEQCELIHLNAVSCGASVDDGSPKESAANGAVALPVCEIGDGQIQAHTTVCGVDPATSTPVVATTASQTPVASISVPTIIATGTPLNPGSVGTTVDPVRTGVPAIPISSADPVYSSTPIDPSHVPSSGLSTVIMGTNTAVSSSSASASFTSAVTVPVPSNTTPITSGAAGKYTLAMGVTTAVVGAVFALMF
ncbi:hypothetical protein BROUX41_005750 [Berkeleyomyces rouxiae]